MSVKPEILNELMEISPLIAGLERKNPYTIPEGYFEGLDISILEIVRADDNPSLLQGIAMKNLMQVPEGYFDLLAGSILDRIKAEQPQSVDEELRSISPMLYSMDKVNVYKTPAGYFENLTEKILNKVFPKQEGKVLSFEQGKTISWMRYAVAAAVVGIVSVISFYLFNHNTSDTGYDSVVKQGIKFAKQNTFDEELNKTSDESIANYLDKTADEADAVQMVASVDQSQLPNEEELMSDEKLIDQLLNESDNKKTTN